MKLKFDVTAQEFKIIKNILEPALPANCTVWVFGSRAKNQAKFNSDLDLALDCKNKVALKTLLLLEEAFEESPLPYTVDIADMRRVELYFKDIIDKQKVLFPIQNNMPTLRFPEFNGEWPHKPVKELAEVKTGSRDTQNRILDGKYPFYVRSDTIERINSFAFDGEAILTSGDGVGVGKNIHYVNGKFDYHQRVYAIYKFKDDLFGPFFFQFFKENFLRRVMRLSAKNSVDSVRMSMITDMLAPAPTLSEQQKIASFLSSVDTRIAQTARKKALLERYKKGVMQKLFSRELRFKDAQGNDFPDWVEMPLGQFVNKVTDSYNPATSAEEWESVELESLGQGNGKILKTFPAITLQSIKTKFRIGDVLFGKLRPYLRKFAQAKFDGVCTSEIWVLRANGVSGKFLYFVVQSNRFNQFANIQSGSKMPRSDWKIVSDAVFAIPTLPEQQKIADFLSAIDRKIDLIATELTHAQTFKKGLLQQMFV